MDGPTPFDFQASSFSREALDLHFMYFTPEEIRRISCCEITQAQAFSVQSGEPYDAGVYSAYLGTFGKGVDTTSKVAVCKTCGLAGDCPGHMGHVELADTIYYPFLLPLLQKILKHTCLNCKRFKMEISQTQLLVDALSRLAPGGIAPREDRVKGGKKSSLQKDCEKDTDGTTLLWEELTAEGRRVFTEEVRPRDPGQHEATAEQMARAFDAAREQVQAKSSGSKAGLPFGRFENSASMESVRDLLKEYVSNMPPKCANCGAKGAKWIRDNFLKLSILRAGETLDMYCPPAEARNILRELWKKERGILDWWIPGCRELGAEAFFLDTILVPPSRFRPTEMATYAGGSESLATQSLQLVDILNANDKLRASLGTETNMDTVEALIELQDAVNSFMDSAKGSKHQKLAKDGIRQLFEKKQGLFRMKMMGKRVNFAARSVISPDLNIETTQIGVPVRIASELTYPEVVTPHNLTQLRKLVKRGDNYPGAALVTQPLSNGGFSLVALKRLPEEKRIALSKQLLSEADTSAAPITVWRHLKNGDPLLVNRQPTLHKPGIMAHTVKVLKQEKTIRMHYANCNTYNADFDGDEMNLHAPQDPIGRVEALQIARADTQYLVPTSGKPLRGLIQDHVIAGVMLSKRDTYLSRSDACMLLYASMRAALEKDLDTTWDKLSDVFKDKPWDDPNKGKTHALRPRVVLDPPAIRKPVEMWTGKQIFSMLLKNLIRLDKEKKRRKSPTASGGGLNFESKSQTPGDLWNARFDGNKEEATVMFMDTDLLSGVLDKKQFGASKFGLIHVIFELVGADGVGAILSAMARLYSLFLQLRGFTCAFRDLVLHDDAEVDRRQRIIESRGTAKNTIVEWLEKHGASPPNGAGSSAREINDATRKVLERERLAAEDLEGMMLGRMKNCWGEVVNACFPGGTRLPFPKNCFAAMVQTGAKGSKVNQSMVTCCLGQQELEGRQPPLTVTRRALPCFAPCDLTSRTRGYITDRFLTGIRPQEFFYHCMAGREGLVDTAVKTSRSGYLQRCLVKHLESLKVCYDHSVRDADGAIVQFLYGEDGVEVTLASHLFEFPTLHSNFNLLRSASRGSLQQLTAKKIVDGETALTYIQAKREAELGKLACASSRLKKLIENSEQKDDLDALACSRLRSTEERLRSREREKGATVKKTAHAQELMEPVSSILTPAHFYGATSEHHEEALQKFITDALAKGTLTQDTANEFTEYMRLKFMRCLAQPGEAVGVVAAQSMGEPSTQMTLNTFHLAGHGGANVTLGIPRLREIIQTAAKSCSTPLMSVKVLQSVSGDTSLKQRLLQANLLAGRYRQVTLLECLERIVVHDKTKLVKGNIVRFYHVRLEFFEIEELTKRVPHVTRAVLEKYLRGPFARRLKSEVMRLSGATKISKPSAAKAKRGKDEGEEVAADGDGDDLNPERKKSKVRKVGKGLREAAEGDADGAEAEDEAQGVVDDPDVESENSGMYESTDDEEKAIANGELEGEIEAEDEGGENSGEKADAAVDRAEVEEDLPVPKKRRTETSASSPGTGGFESLMLKADSAQVVCAIGDKLEGNTMSFIVALKHVDCPHRLMLPEVIHDLCAGSLLQDEIAKGVRQVTVREDKDGVTLDCEGVNVHAFHAMPPGTVDVHRIKTNDIRAILDTYGVEAARASLVGEVKAVFGHYGIEVNHRHLSLIADYMTQGGKIKAFNRLGMESNFSPLQQMSFETTMLFMSKACQDNIVDTMKAPSSSIVVGQPPQLGTGMVSLLCDLAPENPTAKKRTFNF